jgi:hypothetical protein
MIFKSWKNKRKLDLGRLKTQENNSGNRHCGLKTTIVPNPSNWVILCSSFLKGEKSIKENLNVASLDPT